MLKKSMVMLASGFFLIAFRPVYATDCQAEKVGFLPLTYSRTLPIAQVMINGHAVQMGVDTGAEGISFTSAATAALNLPSDPHHLTIVKGAGGTGTIQTHNVLIEDLDVANSRYTNLSAPVIDLPNHPEIVGLLGASILSNYDLEFDFPKRTLTFYRLQDRDCSLFSPPWQQPYAQIPVTLTPAKMFLAQVELDSHLLVGLFDTGASDSSVNTASLVNAGLISSFLARDLATTGAGTTGKYKGSVHHFNWLKIGGEKFTDPQINIHSFFSDANFDMVVGEDYISARRFWLSYTTQTLFVQSE